MTKTLERLDIPDEEVTRRLEKVGALYKLGRELLGVEIIGTVKSLRPKPEPR
jgi:hypothetical protein